MPYFLASALRAARAGLVRPACTSANPFSDGGDGVVVSGFGCGFEELLVSGRVLHDDLGLAVDRQHDWFAAPAQGLR